MALIVGMCHALLPGHSKSLVGTYMIQDRRARTREIWLLISSVTLSHTLFIFLLAAIIVMLHKGIGGISLIAGVIAAIGYSCFGVYFFWQGFRKLQKIANNNVAF